MEKRLVRSGEVVIRVAHGLKPGRVMAIADGEILYEARQGGPEFIKALQENAGAYGFVAPDVKRRIDRYIESMKREEDHGKPYNTAQEGR